MITLTDMTDLSSSMFTSALVLPRSTVQPIADDVKTSLLLNYTVSKHPTRVAFSNNSNNPGSISTHFGGKNRHLISI